MTNDNAKERDLGFSDEITFSARFTRLRQSKDFPPSHYVARLGAGLVHVEKSEESVCIFCIVLAS